MHAFVWVRVTESMVRVPEICQQLYLLLEICKYEYNLPIALCSILCVDKILDSCYLGISISCWFGSESSAAHPIYVNLYISPELVCNPTTGLCSVKSGSKSIQSQERG